MPTARRYAFSLSLSLILQRRSFTKQAVFMLSGIPEADVISLKANNFSNATHALPSKHHAITKLKCLPNNQRLRQSKLRRFVRQSTGQYFQQKNGLSIIPNWLLRKSHCESVSNHPKDCPAIIPNGQKKKIRRNWIGFHRKAGFS